ncbi:hypothetical protein GCK32_021047 [Trichostrongylus colubriformis]|uniref:Uncharacterized protein n=1 Tax=Trichostrongylus colubriformis TaxID=6319 RepID=A0AAN8FXI2_TRICO
MVVRDSARLLLDLLSSHFPQSFHVHSPTSPSSLSLPPPPNHLTN